MRLSEVGEFRLIKSIRSLCRKESRDIIFGIGDDAAAVRSTSNSTLLTSDMMLEGVHFDLSYTSFYQLGHKILAVNISDILAMGGKPKYFLIDIGIPGDYHSRVIRDIYRGMKGLADKFGVAIVGGDTCSSRKDLILSGTLTGEAARPVSRKGARPGDGIYVNGTLGDSSLGLMILKSSGGVSPGKPRAKLRVSGFELPYRSLSPLIKRHLTPEPVPLKRTQGITSMIDISDGLLMDLGHICDESGVGAEIHTDRLPLSKPLLDTCRRLGKDPLDFATMGGEDYLLLFTARSRTRKDAVRIGRIIEKDRYIVGPDGSKASFKAGGYEHFR
jgi:thiamine-monophosphate kinase